MFNYIILGAGPSGLSFARTLLDHGEKSFLVIEKEEEVGGLCRSRSVDGSPLDIGGGHFLDNKHNTVTEFLFRFLEKEQWNLFKRKSTIQLGNQIIDYPIEANIWQLSIAEQVEYIESIAYCGSNLGLEEPATFREWILWKLGDRIAQKYMFPYNRKIWSIELEELGVYWINKLPDITFNEILTSCLTKKFLGRIPAHQTFYYPGSFGYGEVWKRMGNELGNHLQLSTNIESIDFLSKRVNEEYEARIIINTVPWDSMNLKNIPDEISTAVQMLEHSSIQIDYFNESKQSSAHWIYIPDEKIPYHRILNRESFMQGAKGYWTETNAKRAVNKKNMVFLNEYAYPLNTKSKPRAIKTILTYAETNGIYGLGRWGTWEHINSDQAVLAGINLAKQFLGST